MSRLIVAIAFSLAPAHRDLHHRVAAWRDAARYYHHHAQHQAERAARPLRPLRLSWRPRRAMLEAFYWRREARALRRAPSVQWSTAVASDYGIGDGFLGSGVACPRAGVLDLQRPIVANRTLPCGTRLEICYQGRCAEGVIWDRGPFVVGRDFDLGPMVTRTLHFSGVGLVRWTLLGRRG